MKKTIALSLVLILITMLLSGCFYDAVTDNGNRFFKDIIRGIEYEYDYDWDIEGETSREAFFEIKPKDTQKDGLLYCSTVYFMDGVANESDEFEKFKNDLSLEYTNPQIISESSGVNKNGNSYREIIYTFSDEYQNNYTHCDRIILINNLVVYASGRSKTENYDSLRSSYDIFFDTVTAYQG